MTDRREGKMAEKQRLSESDTIILSLEDCEKYGLDYEDGEFVLVYREKQQKEGEKVVEV